MNSDKKISPLNLILNEDGFKFIGIDKKGNHHFCIVRKCDDSTYYMCSNTITFDELQGWIKNVN